MCLGTSNTISQHIGSIAAMVDLHYVWIIGFFIVLFVLFVVSAFFSASEVALIASNRLRIRHMISRKVANASRVRKLLGDMDSLITTILVGNNLVNITITVMSTMLFVYFLGNTFLVGLMATLITSFLILVFAEMLPKMYAVRGTERLALVIAIPMEVTVALLRPVSRMLNRIAHATLRLFGISIQNRASRVTEEEIKTMIEMAKEQGVVGDEEKNLLHRIFEFGDRHVQDAMIPLTKVIAFEESETLGNLLHRSELSTHTRFPVYRNAKDNIVGIIYAREIARSTACPDIKIKDLTHPAYSVPASRKIIELLKDFQKKRIQIAVVTDDDRKIVGLITLEDILEEIVGEITDDHPNVIPICPPEQGAKK